MRNAWPDIVEDLLVRSKVQRGSGAEKTSIPTLQKKMSPFI